MRQHLQHCLVSYRASSLKVLVGILASCFSAGWCAFLFAHAPQLVLKQLKSAPYLGGIRALVRFPYTSHRSSVQ